MQRYCSSIKVYYVHVSHSAIENFLFTVHFLLIKVSIPCIHSTICGEFCEWVAYARFYVNTENGPKASCVASNSLVFGRLRVIV